MCFLNAVFHVFTRGFRLSTVTATRRVAIQDAPSLSDIPAATAFAIISFVRAFQAAPDWFRLFYHNTMLNDNRVKNSAWILLTMLCGMFLASCNECWEESATAKSGWVFC